MVTGADVALAVLTVALLGAGLLGGYVVIRGHASPGTAMVGSALVTATCWLLAIEVGSPIVGVSQSTLLSAAVIIAAVLSAVSVVRPQVWRDTVSDGRHLAAACRPRAWRGTWQTRALGICAAIGALVMAGSLVVAAVGAPNNADSIGYHLPRVMWWLQQGHIGSYVTPNPSQATFPPLSSYLLLIVRGISGNDLALNLVQWTAGAFGVAAVLVVAWAASRSRATVAAVFVLVATMPMAIAESTTTQSDWVAALWPLTAAALIAERYRQRISFRLFSLLLGFSCLLTMATKPTSALMTALLVLVAVVLELWRRNIRPGERAVHSLLVIGVSGAFAALGVIPQALRNIALTGSPTGLKTEIFVEHPSLTIAWANTVRTVFNNLGVPAPLSDPLNAHLPQMLAVLGVPWQDPNAIFLGNQLSIGLGRNEDLSTNPIHVILGLGVALAVVLMPRAPRMIRIMSAVAVLSFVGTAGVLQWQQWSTRFFLGPVALACLPLGWLTARWLMLIPGRVTLRSAAAAVVLGCSAVYGLAVSIAQEYRPLVGPGSVLTTTRLDQYLRVVTRPGATEAPRSELLAKISALQELPPGATIGVRNLRGQEYIVWRLLNDDGRYTFVNLDGIDGTPVRADSSVDGVICLLDCP